MFDPVRICRILNEEGVDYIVVGGMATVMHGSVLPTQDLDLVPDRSAVNLERLASALRRMNSRIRTRDEALDVRIDVTFLANSTVMLILICDHGDLDIACRPSGSCADFASWRRHATEMHMAENLIVLVASLDDIIESKRAADRPKDIAALPYLESLRDELAD